MKSHKRCIYSVGERRRCWSKRNSRNKIKIKIFSFLFFFCSTIIFWLCESLSVHRCWITQNATVKSRSFIFPTCSRSVNFPRISQSASVTDKEAEGLIMRKGGRRWSYCKQWLLLETSMDAAIATVSTEVVVIFSLWKQSIWRDGLFTTGKKIDLHRLNCRFFSQNVMTPWCKYLIT